MPCYSPNVIVRDSIGDTRFISGHRLRDSLSFNPNASICGGSNKALAYKYHSHKFNAVEFFPVACKSCIGCRLNYSRQWAIRSVHENQMYNDSSFITLTYNDENLPHNSTLVLEHMTNFFKNLRRKLEYTRSNKKFRYMYCGEYGDQYGRPHYHALLFGLDFYDKKFLKDVEGGHPLYKSAVLDRVWGKGHCFIGGVTFESAAYVSRYVNKKVNGKLADEHYSSFNEYGEYNRKKTEYMISSRGKPYPECIGGGLGVTFFEKYHKDIYPSDEVVVKGKQMRPPSYYDTLLERSNPSLFEEIKEKRLITLDELGDSEERWIKRLIVKEEIKLKQVARLLRPFE